MTTQTKVIPMALIAAALVLAPWAGHAHSVAPLSDGVKAGVAEALEDEYRGEAMYSRVLKDHGEVRSFSNIVRAERRHAALLVGLLKARGLAVPDQRGARAETPAFESVKEACAAAVEFETKNVALYDRLIAAGSLPEDVKQVFDYNRMASLDHHKPAFERCAGLATAQGAGCGGSRGQAGGRNGQGCGHCGQCEGRGQGRGPHGSGQSW
jgi:hypothetical protein